MHGTRLLALLALLATPAAPALPLAAPALPEPLPLALDAPDGPAELVIGVPTTLPLAVRSAGLAGTGAQPPLERRVLLNATADSGDGVLVAPNPLRLAAGAGEANATLAFTPGRLGPLGIEVGARWETLPGNASLRVARVVVKDPLAVEGLAAGAPDADLDVPLAATLRSAHLAAEPLAWRVEAEHTPVNGTGPLRWTAASGQGTASPAGEPWAAEVRARYGAGAYVFRLEAGGARLADAAATVAVDVPEVRTDGGAVNFTLEVEDHPTTLRLASDTVNADNKTKRPGDALVTRVVVGDRNGLGDVRRVTFTYAREDGAARTVVFARSVVGLGAGLEATVEDRFDLAPLKDAAYVCTVTAEGTGSPAVARTFVITDAQPEATLRLDAAAFLPSRAGALNGTLAVRDANFGTGPLDGTDVTELGAFQLLLYKGSARVGEAGWSVSAAGAEGAAPLAFDLSAEGSRSTRLAYRVVDGKGELALPVTVRIPEGASPGAYRLAFADDATLASAPFNVTPLPKVTRLALLGEAAPGAAVPFAVEAGPVEHAFGLELRAPWGARLRAEAHDLVAVNGTWRWEGALPLPAPYDDDAAANLTVVADLGDGRVVTSPAGAPVNARSAPLAVANVAPSLAARLLVGGASVGEEAWLHPHASGALAAEAEASDPNALADDLRDEVRPLEAEVRDWNGQPARFDLDGDLAPGGASLAVRPRGAEPGRYTLLLRARDDDGAVAERRLAVNVGTHFRLGVEAPADGIAFAPGGDGAMHAALPVRATGNAAAGALAVLAEGLPPGASATASLALANGTRLDAPLAGGFARFEAPRLLAPGEAAELRLRVDAGAGVPAGLFRGRIVLAGEAA